MSHSVAFHSINFALHWHLNTMPAFIPDWFLSSQCKAWSGNIWHIVAAENESPSICWCVWLGIWSTVVGAWARQEPAPCDGSHTCIWTAQVQRNVWFILHKRRWALIYLSSVVWTLPKIHPKHLHSYFQEAFGNPLCSQVQQFEIHFCWSVGERRQEVSVSNSAILQLPSAVGTELQRKPSPCPELGLWW